MTKYHKFTADSKNIALFTPRVRFVHETFTVVHGPNKFVMDVFRASAKYLNLKWKQNALFLLIFGHLAEIWHFLAFWQNLKCYHFTKNVAKRVLKYESCINISYYVNSFINDQGGVTSPDNCTKVTFRGSRRFRKCWRMFKNFQNGIWRFQKVPKSLKKVQKGSRSSNKF